MTAKKRTPRIVTEATKANLPKPRKRKVKMAEVGTQPAPDFRVVPCMDWPADSLPSGVAQVVQVTGELPPGWKELASDFPDTAPYPWRVQVREWLEDRVEPLRWWLALKLERLAHWVAP